MVAGNEVVPGINIRSVVAGGEEMRMWISLAPASRSNPTICPLVVPRTMESSIRTIRFPSTSSRMGLSLIFTWSTRWP